jgi:hypothetical protein
MTPPIAFVPPPDEYDAEKASNSYLMSLIAIMMGLPLPVINLIATTVFYFGNRKGVRFVRWHCTQALLAQAVTLVMNVALVYWTLAVVFWGVDVSDNYFAYLITVVLFNLVEFIATIYTAIRTRKGIHVSWWFFGPLTDTLVRE